MLRRYSSKNLDTIVLKNRKTTIGSDDSCNIVVKGKNVHPIHATIQSTAEGFYLRDKSLAGLTKLNDKPVFGQREIHAGDLIQVGSTDPFVFDSEWMSGTRPNSAKIPMAGNRGIGTRTPTPVARNPTILPVIEKKVIHGQTSISRESQSPKNKDFGSPTRKRRSAEQSLRSSASSTESRGYGRSVGNNLLQRVIQLQAEVIHRDEKIRQLSSAQSFPAPSHLYFQPSLPPPPLPSLPPQKSFELFAYRAFISAVTSQLRQFNDRVLRTPQRDSAEMFSVMCRAVDIPLSARIVDIGKHCEAVLIDNDFEDGDELIGRLDNFLRESRREKIVELTNELEVLMPLIRDAAANARENIKVCNVFTQWSRQFGDLLRKSSFNATTLFQAIEDLKAQFSDAHMSRHWLPPSITPILRLAALELEKRDGDVTPAATPPPHHQLDRKKSIDMTLDTCISQVEAIVHEMDYHTVRLFNKATDYSAFQMLDLDSVSRISKVIDSMRTSIRMLSEHSFKEDVRPNSVLFFEITNDDITSRKKSESDGSNSSLNSQKRVSAAPKIPDPLCENEEIVEERREVEERMMEVVRGIGGILGAENGQEPMRNEGMISVDASVLKMLIEESQKLMSSYHQNREEEIRRKRSIPPTITVEESSLEGPEAVDSPEVPPEQSSESPSAPEVSPESPQPSDAPMSSESPEEVVQVVQPTHAEPVSEPEASEEESPPEDHSSDEVHSSDTPMPLSDSPDTSPRHQMDTVPEEDTEDIPPRPKRSLKKQLMRKSYSEDGRKRMDWKGKQWNSESHNPIEKASKEGSAVESESDHDEKSIIDDESEEEENTVSEEPIPFADDDKMTVRYIPTTGSQNTPDLTSDESLQMSQEDVVSEELSRRQSNQEKMSSHLRSHLNTANGKPHITYQYPIKYYSPPMKRRSKSEDQKIKDTLSGRPPFVLY